MLDLNITLEGIYKFFVIPLVEKTITSSRINIPWFIRGENWYIFFVKFPAINNIFWIYEHDLTIITPTHDPIIHPAQASNRLMCFVGGSDNICFLFHNCFALILEKLSMMEFWLFKILKMIFFLLEIKLLNFTLVISKNHHFNPLKAWSIFLILFKHFFN